MAIKIKASNNQPLKKKIRIQKCAGLMPVMFHNTANDTRFRIYLTSNLMLYDVYRLLLDLNIIIDPPTHFIWKMYSNNSELDYSLTLYDNHICADSEIKISCIQNDSDANVEITVRIVKGIGSGVCDIDVPMDATVGDVIVGLISEGFLDEETVCRPWALYNNMGSDGDISLGVKYDARYKTIAEYAWKEGQTIVAISPSLHGPIIIIPIILPNMSIYNSGYCIKATVNDLLYQCKDYIAIENHKGIYRSFYYLYDGVNNQIFLGSSEVPSFNKDSYEIVNEFQGEETDGRLLKYALRLERQIVEEIKE